MSESISNSVKSSDECIAEAAPQKVNRHLLRRHFSEDVLGIGGSATGSKLGPRHRLQKTGSRFFQELNARHLLVNRISEGILFRDKDKVGYLDRSGSYIDPSANRDSDVLDVFTGRYNFFWKFSLWKGDRWKHHFLV